MSRAVVLIDIPTLMLRSLLTVRENKLVFCMGDFNVNLLNYHVHNPTNDFLDSMLSNYLLPYILHTTRLTDHSAMVIDNIFSNNAVFESVSGNIMTHILDHFPQFTTLNKIDIKHKNCLYAKRDFSKFNDKLSSILLQSRMKKFVHDKNLSLNSKFGKVYQSLSSHVDNHAPPKEMNKKGLKLHGKPWVTLKILNSSNIAINCFRN